MYELKERYVAYKKQKPNQAPNMTDILNGKI